MKTAALCAIVVLWVAAPGPASAEPPPSLAGIAFEDLSPIDFHASPLIVNGPAVIGFLGPKAVVEFETSIPTPPAVVRYGPVLFAGGIEHPVLRRVAVEAGDDAGDDPGSVATAHRILVDVSKLESPLSDSGLGSGGGGVVVCRVEVYDPDYGSIRTYERRFRYLRDGEPKKGRYRLASTMVHGPFVDLVGPDSFVVSWETDAPAPGVVVVGERRFVSPAPSARHELEVTGLEPRTTYGYRVHYGYDGGTTGTYEVTTAPPRGESGFRFAFASDSRAGAGGGAHAIEGVNHAALTAVLTGARSRGADLVLFGGDRINGYTSSQEVFEGQLASWTRAAGLVGCSLPIYEGVGNHEQVGDYFEVPDPEHDGYRIIMFRDRDDPRSAEAIFTAAFTNPRGSSYGFCLGPETRSALGEIVAGPDYGETVYSFDYGNCHFVSLNTNYWYSSVKNSSRTKRYPSDKGGSAIALEILGGCREGYVMQNQLDWLEEDLGMAQEDDAIDWVFVFTHEPAFPNGGHLWDAMFWGDAGKGHEGGLNDHAAPLGDVIDMRNRLWTTLVRHGKVVAFMSGDEHNYSRTFVDSRVDSAFTRPVWQIVSGGAGAPFYVQDMSSPWSGNVEAFSPVNHYCLFDVTEERVSLTVYSTAGVLIDEVSDFSSHARSQAGE